MTNFIPDYVPTAMTHPDVQRLRTDHAEHARQFAREKGCDCDCEILITEANGAFYAQILHDNWCGVWQA